MQIRSFERRAARRERTVYLVNLFFSLSYAAVVYANSSFLSQFFSATGVSALFIIAALGNIALFFITPALMRAYGARRVFVWFLILQLGALGGLISAYSAYTVAIAFLIYASTAMMAYYCLDIFIEAISEDRRTGEIRGIVLTLDNLAVAMAPLLLSFVVPGVFAPVYIASAVFILPCLFIGLSALGDVRPKRGAKISFRSWRRRTEVRRATLARLALEIFYAVMVIFTPIYLSRVIGFSWPTIGVIFFIMLLSFLIFELPAGELADHWCGERELMTVGFFIMGAAVVVMPFLHASALAWTAALFMSRVGAALVEVTSETHFFRNVGSADAGLISIFRLTRPASVAIGALVGALIVGCAGYPYLFFILAAFVLLGMNESVRLVDSR